MLPSAPLLIAFLAASVAIVVVPGPDVLYVAARSLGQGRRAGAVATLGISCGLMVHGAAAALGLSSLFLAAPFAYEALRWGGIAYLAYLAFRAFRGTDDLRLAALAPAAALRAVWMQAFVTNLLNPKIILFFIAFLPQFVEPDAARPLVQTAMLAALFTLLSLTFQMGLAATAGRLGEWLAARPQAQRLQRWIMGGSLGMLAAWLAIGARR